jgi:glycosyltransferase involved in cell wall biosynthesis
MTLHANGGASPIRPSPNNASPVVSILTPAWNRATYLERVWKALENQTFRDFEWVVANDGSNDGTREVIQHLAESATFPVILIDADKHIGKPRMDNELLNHARGEFILWNDSDDYLVPGALERLIEVWHTIPPEETADYIGLTALCSTEEGHIQSTNTPSRGVFDTTWNELMERFDVHGDKTFFIRRRAVGSARFIEVDFMVTESSLWKDFSDMKTRFIPEALKVMDRTAPNRISYSGKMEYCRGKAYGIAYSDNTPAARRTPLSKKLWKAITYFRYCIHGEIPLRKALSLWDGNLPLPVMLLMYPWGGMFALKDLAQRKVLRTHREFNAASRSVSIRVLTLTAGQRS